jgi:hypothetical protein
MNPFFPGTTLPRIQRFPRATPSEFRLSHQPSAALFPFEKGSVQHINSKPIFSMVSKESTPGLSDSPQEFPLPNPANPLWLLIPISDSRLRPLLFVIFRVLSWR